jgi:hypothetical protein
MNQLNESRSIAHQIVLNQTHSALRPQKRFQLPLARYRSFIFKTSLRGAG